MLKATTGGASRETPAPLALPTQAVPSRAFLAKRLLRALLVVHRYLGVLVGLLMTVWCLSGFVMIYVAYPELTAAERRQGLEAMDLRRCCTLRDKERAAEDGFRIEMLAGTPVIRTAGPPHNLVTGSALPALTAAQAGALAAAHGRRSGIDGAPARVERIEKDQWTVQHFRRHQPLYRVAFDDAAGSVLYVDGGKGEIVQDTTRAERGWNWIGAIPHWLYLTGIRTNGPLWNQLLVWTSLLGCFLTLTGIAAGIIRLKRRKAGRLTPYKGLWAWHHLIGLVAGLFMLSWVASGLFSMTPWGLFESDARPTYRRMLNGPVAEDEVAAFLAAAPAMQLPPDTVRIESVPLGGKLFIVAVPRNGGSVRFDHAGRPAPLRSGEIRATLAAAGLSIARFEAMTDEDDYHYRRRGEDMRPAYRAILADAEATRLYVDRASGALLEAVDRPGRAYRWLHRALHSFDLAPLRGSLWRDAAMLPLMALVTLVAATGCWMGMKRLRTDGRRIGRRWTRLLRRRQIC